MGCSTSTQTTAQDSARQPSFKPEESNGTSTTGAADENGTVVEDSETIPDHTVAVAATTTGWEDQSAPAAAQVEAPADTTAPSPAPAAQAPGDTTAPSPAPAAQAPGDTTAPSPAPAASTSPEQPASSPEPPPAAQDPAETTAEPTPAATSP
ncbi:hypothetical protein J4Q44_G00066530 [Coregonus suidteri]|uniref:Uncharacterized protein n=1 Tax=Coregonus suidteri TaxID=861788 RepID=A0AAN8M752_9TELE